MPGSVLELMQPQHRSRFQFSVGKPARVHGSDVARIDFQEVGRPTIIRSPDGEKDMASRGTVYVKPSTGRVWKGFVAVRDPLAVCFGRPNFENRLEVNFVANGKLGMLVPKDMREDFYVELGSGRGTAIYRNFRRFFTSARILPQ